MVYATVRSESGPRREVLGMKAVAIGEFGGVEVLEPMALPSPEAGPGQLLVKVHACAANPVDTKIRRGMLPLKPTFPLILGYDISGVVEAVGEGVTDFVPGDAVFYSPELTGQGGYAEYHVADAALVTFKPDGFSHVEAASVPLAGMTAWQGLFDRGGLQHGEAVLIHGAAGGVGSLAVQLASWAGCEVYATAGGENHDFVEDLGADVIIDYRSHDFVEAVMDSTKGRGVDVVLDTVGGEVFAKSFAALAPHGAVVSITPEAMEGLSLGCLVPGFFKNAEAHLLFMERRRDTLDSLARLLERGFLDPVVETVLPLERAAEAHRRLESGHGRGKIVFEVIKGS
jgi:NADPH2:quinone reductase